MILELTAYFIRNTAGAIATALLAIIPSQGLADSFVPPDETFSVMTLNLFAGADFKPLLAAKSGGEFLTAVTTGYKSTLASRPDERMGTLAREIARLKPDLIGLQEAAILRTGTVPPATKIEMDLTRSLIDALAELEQPYMAVAILPGLDAEAPTTLGFNVRFTMQDVILARMDRPRSKFSLSNLQVQRFLAQETAMSAVGPITNPSGWASVDVRFNGRSLRFVTTHLAISPGSLPIIPLAQAYELIATAGQTNMPVVLSGDFNTTANHAVDPTYPIYRMFITAGFADLWSKLNPKDAGPTCCREPDLKGPASALTKRVDLILTRGELNALKTFLVANQEAARTSTGLWPSDHAGVIARMKLTQQ
jgi:endonuclease/exonuclease/phosphatase family metal-dependent hydrolase